MGYIGNTYQQQSITPATDFFSGNGVTTSFTLSKPQYSSFNIEVIVNNVQQNPSTSYSISGNTINFSEPPSTGTNNIYVIYNPIVASLVIPGQGTIQSSAFSRPNVLTWDANGNVTAEGKIKGATGVYSNNAIFENPATISANYTVVAGINAMSIGPITVADGVTVTVNDGATWTVV